MIKSEAVAPNPGKTRAPGDDRHSAPQTKLRPKARTYTMCNKCSGELFRSDFRHIGEILIAPIVLPFRCTKCGWRQFRFSMSRVRDKNEFRRAANDRTE